MSIQEIIPIWKINLFTKVYKDHLIQKVQWKQSILIHTANTYSGIF